MSGPIFMGKINVKWCDECDLPVIGERCDICNNVPREMKITPPGEMRFLFKEDFKRVDEILSNYIKGQFSEIVKDYAVLLNKIPNEDRAEEIIMHGDVIFTIYYKNNSYHLSLRPIFYDLFKEYIKGKIVIADDGAIESIKEGKNLMWPGVLEYSKDINENDHVFVLDRNKNCIATGIFKKPKDGKGVSVKIKYLNDKKEIKVKKANIDKIIKANISYLNKIEAKAIREIKKFEGKNVLVSFSGGKDSLVSLYLTILSGIKFKVFFLNTGLEFPETINYVNKIKEKYGIDMDIIDAGDAFFKSLNHFGPPGRDYRWCCKVCKLGPTTRYLINKGEVYVIIGQRKYESFTRYKNSRQWENEWVPNQKAFSPIQNWDSLSIWLYIFYRNLEYNPWYEKGLWRIGCYLCPSQDMGDIEIVKKFYKDYKRWEDYLYEYFKGYKDAEIRIKYGLWRWNNIPEHLKNEFGVENINRNTLKLEFEEDEKIRIKIDKFDKERLKNMLNILPREVYNIKENYVEAEKSLKDQLVQIIYQSEECVGCGICSGRCKYNAIEIRDNKAWIIEDLCMNCSACLGPCPAYVFR